VRNSPNWSQLPPLAPTKGLASFRFASLSANRGLCAGQVNLSGQLLAGGCGQAKSSHEGKPLNWTLKSLAGSIGVGTRQVGVGIEWRDPSMGWV